MPKRKPGDLITEENLRLAFAKSGHEVAELEVSKDGTGVKLRVIVTYKLDGVGDGRLNICAERIYNQRILNKYISEVLASRTLVSDRSVKPPLLGGLGLGH